MLGLKEKYKKEVVPKMKELRGYKTVMAVPKIEKVTINTGFGRLVAGKSSGDQKQIREAILSDLALIAGQRPSLTKAKKSISSFKLREGSFIGAKATLRGRLMYDFLTRLINISLPRSRDFRGINPEVLDRQGNLTIGLREQIIFPEIMPEKTRMLFGLEIIVTTSAKTKEEALELLKLLGFPFIAK